MTKSLFVGLAVTILAASSMLAQDGGQIRINLPFDFMAGSHYLPAGEYYARISHSPDLIRMDNADGKHSLLVLAHSVQCQGPTDTASFVFHKYGDRYFLWRVLSYGSGMGEELPRSREEREQIADRHASKTVTVLASVR